MSFEERRQNVSMDLESSTLLRILKRGDKFDPYEEMQKLPSLIAVVVFDSATGRISVYSGCIFLFRRRRLLDEKEFEVSEDESFLISCLSKAFSINDAIGVYRYINDLLFVRKRVPKFVPSLN